MEKLILYARERNFEELRIIQLKRKSRICEVPLRISTDLKSVDIPRILGSALALDGMGGGLRNSEISSGNLERCLVDGQKVLAI